MQVRNFKIVEEINTSSSTYRVNKLLLLTDRFFWVLDDLSQITFVLDDMSQKGNDMYQKYMDDLSQFVLVLEQFVTILFNFG